jgi:cytochrome c peroxidase
MTKLRTTYWLALPILLVGVYSSAAERSLPLGLPDLPTTSPNDHQGLVRLGSILFDDRRLSVDGNVSCGSCHRANRQFTDGRALAVGIHKQIGTRNTPSLENVVYSTTLFWDGRSTGLQEQALLPLLNPREHGLVSADDLVVRVQRDSGYREQFRRVFGRSAITEGEIAAALAAYERTLLAGDSPFDRYVYGGDVHALSESAIRGMELFRGRAGCAACHTIGPTAALLTDQSFHSSPEGLPDGVNAHLVELTQRVAAVHRVGDVNEMNALIVSDPQIAALGRFVVTQNPADIGLFKTPSLRNVADTAPYLHDGSVSTLAEVIEMELYQRGDAVRAPIVASVAERADLLEFLKALSSPRPE